MGREKMRSLALMYMFTVIALACFASAETAQPSSLESSWSETVEALPTDEWAEDNTERPVRRSKSSTSGPDDHFKITVKDGETKYQEKTKEAKEKKKIALAEEEKKKEAEKDKQKTECRDCYRKICAMADGGQYDKWRAATDACNPAAHDKKSQCTSADVLEYTAAFNTYDRLTVDRRRRDRRRVPTGTQPPHRDDGRRRRSDKAGWGPCKYR